MVNLTFTLVEGQSYLQSLTVNNVVYNYSDFTNDSMTLQFEEGTSIIWSVDAGKADANPSNGNFTLNTDTTVTISILR